MSPHANFPSQLHWSAHDLAAAVPLRLFELYRFERGDADDASRPARVTPARDLRGGYVRPAPLPTRFSVHH